ncbi:DUF6776 family protein [Marilutibacter spongiae]|uniref:Transmembrane protein n=1 Tax=Marilutibacter spongiae TaxID=2025720 RepID=A0A7W3TPM1_9GAMM|nr:DUF6776 family protein [Lysobacter spongiae]MBB1062156.1 hypothetical protein [Lysobacter spongiae]
MTPTPHREPPARYRIVRDGPDRRPLWLVLALLAWAGSLVAVWQFTRSIAAPKLPQVSQALGQAEGTLRRQGSELEELRQRAAILEKSDQITRDANKQVQRTLAEREEEIAGLRADVAFYERLVGATSPRKGLNVHSSQFVPEAGGTWRYEIVLTQNLNRGAVSTGQLKFQVEGVQDGKLAVIDWGRLHQKQEAAGQAYSFRYFQQLSGSIMLPVGFTPQRVRVRLNTGEKTVDQTLAWQVGNAGEDARAVTSTAVAATASQGES